MPSRYTDQNWLAQRFRSPDRRREISHGRAIVVASRLDGLTVPATSTLARWLTWRAALFGARVQGHRLPVDFRRCRVTRNCRTVGEKRGNTCTWWNPFIGRHLVEQLLASGHGVTLANRGKSDPATFGSMPHRSIDRDGDMTSLSSGRWDATIDLSGSLPQQVRGASSALADRGGTYLFVSTTAGVDTPQRYGFTEQDPLVDLAEGGSADLNGGTCGA